MKSIGTSKAAENALRTAIRQENNLAREALLRVVEGRIKGDEAFRRQFQLNPDKAVLDAASDLPEEQAKKVDPMAVKDVVSKAQSILPGIEVEDLRELVKNTINDARQAFNLSLRLTKHLFYYGLIVTATTLAFSFFSEDKEWITVAIGTGGGALGIIGSLVINSVDRVQNAAGNLIQIEIAFLGYYKQLTFFARPWEKADPQTPAIYASEVRQAMLETVKLVEEYCEYRK